VAIPDFQSIMLPLLQTAADGAEHIQHEINTKLAEFYQLTDAERSEMLPSAKQARFDNRVGWARSYLQKAGLMESTGRARFRITPRGIDVLKKNPKRIDMKFLQQFPEYMELKNDVRGIEEHSTDTSVETDKQTQTPEERLESSYQNLKQALAQELLARIKKATPRFFENLVVDLLVAMGYGGSRRDAGQAVGQSGDDGIDGIIKEDKLGLDAIYIQAKRWDSSIGRPIVQAFAGSLEGHRARKGVLITTSTFTTDAREYVTRIEKKIVLIDGKLLSELMIEHGVGLTEIVTYSVKKIDLDYFGEE